MTEGIIESALFEKIIVTGGMRIPFVAEWLTYLFCLNSVLMFWAERRQLRENHDNQLGEFKDIGLSV